jgi:hypothetical protein
LSPYFLTVNNIVSLLSIYKLVVICWIVITFLTIIFSV